MGSSQQAESYTNLCATAHSVLPNAFFFLPPTFCFIAVASPGRQTTSRCGARPRRL
jgi:hypothetical protein